METAGGVLSPTIAGSLQADVYRSLLSPTVLVGDHRLGGISATLTAYESLKLRGWDVPYLFLVDDPAFDNASMVERHIDKSTTLFKVQPLPPMLATQTKDLGLERWFDQEAPTYRAVANAIIKEREQLEDKINEMASYARHHIWWPFTQHKNVTQVSVVDSAYGDDIVVSASDGKAVASCPTTLFDACGAWWTQGVGHGNPLIARAMANAQGRYGHVLFPEHIHAPASDLARRLLEGVGDNWASRVFYSDNGSTAIEVALKMAFKLKGEDRSENDVVVLGLSDSYHGDTIGAMDAGSPSVFNGQVSWYKARGVWINAPKISFAKGRHQIEEENKWESASWSSLRDVFSLERDGSSIARKYEELIQRWLDEVGSVPGRRLGALLIEPIVHGSSGMQMIDPLFQRLLIRAVKKRAIPVIYDEVFTGFYRLGCLSAINLLHETPDIACYSKLITGGSIPLGVTLARESIFDKFLSNKKVDALLHGHSYTANPSACASALAALDIYDQHAKNRVYDDYWDANAVAKLSFIPCVKRVTALGSILAVELASASSGYSSDASLKIISDLRARGIYARPLGNVVYLLCSPLTSKVRCSELLSALLSSLESTNGAEAS